MSVGVASSFQVQELPSVTEGEVPVRRTIFCQAVPEVPFETVTAEAVCTALAEDCEIVVTLATVS